MELDNRIVARETEKKLLLDLYAKKSSELVSITGRRRVGKTFLVTEVLKNKIDFYLTGVQGGKKQEQLINFSRAMARAKGNAFTDLNLTDWQAAFFALEDHLNSLSKKEKLVVFLDELPWLASKRSGFLSAFSHFWNSWAERENILVIICGSAASWMINKVVRNKGGLHNRITQRINLEPFNLNETQSFLESRQFDYGIFEIAELYMTIGGIPHYLNQLSPHETVAQNLDRLAFTRHGMLQDEFERLYPALFEHADRHLKIIKALSNHHYGLDRKQISAQTSLKNGGGLTRILEELEFSGFIKSFYAFGKRNRNKRFRLIDEYSNFYLRFIEKNRLEGRGTWHSLYQTQSYKTWRGYAFENLGLRHYNHIKTALGIAGIATTSSIFYTQAEGANPGLQIDLLIDRNDGAINLCEFKFSENPIKLDTSKRNKLKLQKERFRQLSGSTKLIFLSLITTKVLPSDSPLHTIFNQLIYLEDLFASR
ncbi:MAG: ATP-binding protein [Bacteroidota bacterium]